MKQDLEEQKRLTKKYERMLLQERVQNTSIRNRLHAKEQEQHTMSQKFKTQYLEEKNRRITSDKTFKMQYKTLKETHLDVVTTKDQAIKELKALVKGLKKDVSQHEKKSEKNEQKIEQLQQAKSKLSADIMTALKTCDLYKKEATLFQRDLLKMKKEESLWSKKNLDHQQKMASIELEKLKTKKELEKMKVSLLDKQAAVDISKKKAIFDAKIKRDLLLRDEKEDRKKKQEQQKMEEANNMIRHSQNAMAASLGMNGGRFSIREDASNTIKSSISLEKVSNLCEFSNFF